MAERKHYTKAELQARKAKAAPTFRYGWPTRPKGLDRQLRRYWNSAAMSAYTARKLSETDGELIFQYAQAKLVGDLTTQRRIAETFSKREAFPEPTTPAAAPELEDDAAPTLTRFLASVAEERGTFQQRLRPGSTLTLDLGDVEYPWPEADAAAVARRYALDITQGAVVAGELIVRACHRFLSDLESGHERGIFFDPAAARHIAQFSEWFCGLTLLPWQTFCLANIFGFKKPSGARRFTEAWCSTAKKSVMGSRRRSGEIPGRVQRRDQEGNREAGVEGREAVRGRQPRTTRPCSAVGRQPHIGYRHDSARPVVGAWGARV